MTYPTYPEYKDSGVEWLGKIPCHWNTFPIKRSVRIINGATPKSGIKEYWDGDISWITPADMGKEKTPYLSQGKRNITKEGLQSCGTTLVPAGSVILSSRAPIGALAIALNELCTNQGCKSLVLNRLYDEKYLYYILSSSQRQLNLLGRGTTFLELSADDLGSYKAAAPCINEQTQIATFLDRETQKTDRLIEKQQQLIKLLQEKRQAVISHAVTKGLNPNAKMKDSGVEWVGEIPEHWVEGKVKYIVENLDKHRIPLSSEERGSKSGEYPYYGASGIIDYIDDYIFDQENILYGEDGANLLARSTPLAFIAEGKYWVNNHAHILSAKDGLNRFWVMVLENIDITPVVSGSAQPKLTAEALGDLDIVYPADVAERKKITDYLEVELKKIDQLIEKCKAAINLSKERRTALISAAVTGKIDVRNITDNRSSNRPKAELDQVAG